MMAATVAARSPDACLPAESPVAMDMLTTVPITKEHEDEWGNFNEFPPGWTEIQEGEFAQSGFFTLTWEMVEFRQMLRHKDGRENTEKCALSARLFFCSDVRSGYAIANDYWHAKVRYFKFGCAHAWKFKSVGKCLNNWTCEKCGYSKDVDSSD